MTGHVVNEFEGRAQTLVRAMREMDPHSDEAAALRTRTEAMARSLMADPEWWELATPLYAEALSSLFDTYGVRIGDTMVRASHSWRWDDLLADLVVELSARLMHAGPGAELIGLKAVRWLRWWSADARRQRDVAEALGVPYPPPPPTFPGCLVTPYLVPNAASLRTLAADLTDPSGVGGQQGWSLVDAARACMGFEVVPAPPEHRLRPRPWLWCWELEIVPPRSVPMDETGQPVPLPVVVPADFDPEVMPDRYGFAAERTPGEQLVVDDLERVAACWSSSTVGPLREAVRRRGERPSVRVPAEEVDDEPTASVVQLRPSSRSAANARKPAPPPDDESDSFTIGDQRAVVRRRGAQPPAAPSEPTEAERIEAARRAAYEAVAGRWEPWRSGDPWHA